MNREIRYETIDDRVGKGLMYALVAGALALGTYGWGLHFANELGKRQDSIENYLAGSRNVCYASEGPRATYTKYQAKK